MTLKDFDVGKLSRSGRVLTANQQPISTVNTSILVPMAEGWGLSL